MRAGARTAVRGLFIGLAADGCVLLVLAMLGLVRLWPRISGQHLPWSLIWPVARPLVAAGLELAFLLSAPIALAFVQGTAAPREAGVRSWQSSLLAVCGTLVILGGPTFAISSWLDGRGSAPGQLATELVASARERCTESGPRTQVVVPVLSFAWECEAGRAPLLLGRAPLGQQATFRAAAITLSDDLKRITLEGFTLSFPMSTLHVQVHARQAALRGLPPWGRSRKIPIGFRVGLFALSAGFSAFAVTRLVNSYPWLPGWARSLLGGGVSGCLYLAWAWLERREPHGLTYLVLPLAGLFGASAEVLFLWTAGRLRAR